MASFGLIDGAVVSLNISVTTNGEGWEEPPRATGVICQEDSGRTGNSELKDPDETHVTEVHEVHGDQLELHRRGQFPKK